MRLSLAASLLVTIAACDPPKLTGTIDVRSGLLRGNPPTYIDEGEAPPTVGIRALISLPVRDEAALDVAIEQMYTPGSATFRAYLTRDELLERFAPSEQDLDIVLEWLESTQLSVARIADNRLLIQVVGTVTDFNAAFGTKLHLFSKVEDSSFRTYGTQSDLLVPRTVADSIDAVVVADLLADNSELPGEAGSITTDPPPDNSRLSLATIERNYGLDALGSQGFTGQGTTIGVVVGAGFKFKDVQSFWQGQGVTRRDPELVVTMEPLATRFTETTLDVEWSGGLAPGADQIVYAGPDAHETSLVYTFNAAVADARAHIITDSFAHREDATSRVIRHQYDISAKFAAALGIMICAASGDSGEPDSPASSPFVTSVGGTVLSLDGAGVRTLERAWVLSGSGDSKSFDPPAWQAGLPIGTTRAVSDVAMPGGTRYWTYLFGEWRSLAGTSYSSPVFAGLMAVVNSARLAAGKPRVGFLNPLLYTDPNVRAAFRDVTSGATDNHPAGPGWDYPTGWGTPDAAALATALP